MILVYQLVYELKKYFKVDSFVCLYLQIKNFRLQMSIVNLEVKISKIRIKTYQNCGICFSLRLGRILSNLSMTTPNQNDNEITPDLNLAIGCEENMLKINTRASLVIYQVQSQQKREIIGMVFVLLKEKQSQFRKYKIQQSNDPDSFVELSFSITAIQLKQKENQSMASKSSLADIRELHHALNRGHKKRGSDLSNQQQQKKKARMSPQDKERQLKNRNSNSHKNTHLKSEQCNPFDNDPSYAVLLSKAEQQLSKERERTSLLTNLLVIQQQKNNQSESFIKCIITSLESLITNSTQHEEKQYSLTQKSNKNIGHTKKIHEYETEPTIKKDIDDNNSIKIQTILKERDQLYHISQQLYDKTKLYKVENENLYKNSRNLENEMKLYLKEIEDLKFENAELKKNVYELSDKKQNGKDSMYKKYNEISVLNQQLKKDNFEFQRKFKESLKALQQFKRDAWKAQQQVIKRDQQIIMLKQELESLRSLSGHHKSEEVGSYQKEDKQCIKQSLQSLKLMSALMVKNSMERQMIMQKIQEKKRDSNKLVNQDLIKVLGDFRKRVENYYLSLESQNKKTISIVQMKRKITQIINITQF